MFHVKSQDSRTQYRGVAQLGSASALGAEGRRFESCRLDHQRATKKIYPQKNSDFIRVFSVFTGKILGYNLNAQKRYFSQNRLELSHKSERFIS